MPAFRDKRTRRWFFRAYVARAGIRERISGTPGVPGPYQDLANSKAGAQEAERRAVQEVAAKTSRAAAPTIEEFWEAYLAVSTDKNKPSSVAAKDAILRTHIRKHLGHLRLDQITYAVIEDFKITLRQSAIGNVTRRKDGQPSAPAKRSLSKKTVNNVLTVLRHMLVIARKRGIIESVPEFEWHRAPPPDFDFLTFDETERLIAAAQPEWRAAIVTAVRTGLRLGELIALRWQDVDLVSGRLFVKQNNVRGIIGTPKSGKAREIPLSDQVLVALKAHRHLRGPLVFCEDDGSALRVPKTRYAIDRACRSAGLRMTGWHVLRHTFASHLVMRGVPLKVVQELLGHATIQMTMRYAHLSPEVSRDAVKLLDQPWRTGANEAKSEKK